VFEKALDDEEMEEDTEAGDEESTSEPEDEEQVGKLSEHFYLVSNHGQCESRIQWLVWYARHQK